MKKSSETPSEDLTSQENSKPSQIQKVDISSNTVMLTPLEIASLRKQAKENHILSTEYFKKRFKDIL